VEVRGFLIGITILTLSLHAADVANCQSDEEAREYYGNENDEEGHDQMTREGHNNCILQSGINEGPSQINFPNHHRKGLEIN